MSNACAMMITTGLVVMRSQDGYKYLEHHAIAGLLPASSLQLLSQYNSPKR